METELLQNIGATFGNGHKTTLMQSGAYLQFFLRGVLKNFCMKENLGGGWGNLSNFSLKNPSKIE